MNSLKYNDCRDTYNSVADRYYELFSNELDSKPYDFNVLDKFCNYFKAESSICNVGCGPTDDITEILKKRSINMTGVDISDRCIEIAQSNNPDVTYVREDFLETTLPNNHFDGIISYHSLMYIPKRLVNIYFENLRKILKQEGKILLVTKEGAGEIITNDILGIQVNQLETYFKLDEIKNYFTLHNFKIDFLESREPYLEEIQMNRIYCIATKF